MPVITAALAMAAVPGAPAVAATGAGQPVTSATVVSGVVTSNGKTVPGAQVNVLAWPSVDFLAKLPAGAKIEEKVVGQAAADKNGSFAVSVDPQSLGKEYVSASGSVDFALTAAGDGHQIRWNFTSAKAPGAQGSWGNPRVAPGLLAQRRVAGHAPARLSIDLGDNARVVEEGNEPDKWVGNNGQPLGMAKGMQAAKVAREPKSGTARATDGNVSPQACSSWYAVDDYQYGKTERFVQAIGSGNAKPVVDQEVGTQHTMGIAYTTPAGGWSQSGSLSVSFGASAETTYPAGANLVYNQVNYRLYEQFCYGWYYQWRPIGYYALNSGFGPLISPYWSNCTTYYNGTYTKTSGSNVVFSAGVTLAQLSVSAQAQFTSNTKLKWTFTGASKLCGSNSSGWASAPEAGAYAL